MSDLISRRAVIETITNLLDDDDISATELRFYDFGLKRACEILGELPSAQQGQQWIPVSERLPEKNGRYLVTNTQWGAYEVDWDIFYKEQNDWLFGKDVIAWMPLPEPYKEEK